MKNPIIEILTSKVLELIAYEKTVSDCFSGEEKSRQWEIARTYFNIDDELENIRLVIVKFGEISPQFSQEGELEHDLAVEIANLITRINYSKQMLIYILKNSKVIEELVTNYVNIIDTKNTLFRKLENFEKSKKLRNQSSINFISKWEVFENKIIKKENQEELIGKNFDDFFKNKVREFQKIIEDVQFQINILELAIHELLEIHDLKNALSSNMIKFNGEVKVYYQAHDEVLLLQDNFSRLKVKVDEVIPSFEPVPNKKDIEILKTNNKIMEEYKNIAILKGLTLPANMDLRFVHEPLGYAKHHFDYFKQQIIYAIKDVRDFVNGHTIKSRRKELQAFISFSEDWIASNQDYVIHAFEINIKLLKTKISNIDEKINEYEKIIMLTLPFDGNITYSTDLVRKYDVSLSKLRRECQILENKLEDAKKERDRDANYATPLLKELKTFSSIEESLQKDEKSIIDDTSNLVELENSFRTVLNLTENLKMHQNKVTEGILKINKILLMVNTFPKSPFWNQQINNLKDIKKEALAKCAKIRSSVERNYGECSLIQLGIIFGEFTKLDEDTLLFSSKLDKFFSSPNVLLMLEYASRRELEDTTTTRELPQKNKVLTSKINEPKNLFNEKWINDSTMESLVKEDEKDVPGSSSKSELYGILHDRNQNSSTEISTLMPSNVTLDQDTLNPHQDEFLSNQEQESNINVESHSENNATNNDSMEYFDNTH